VGQAVSPATPDGPAPGFPSASRAPPADLRSAVANDVTQRPKSFVYRVGVRKHFSNVGVKHHHHRVLCKPTRVFPANASGEVVLRQHLLGFMPGACLPHTLSVPSAGSSEPSPDSSEEPVPCPSILASHLHCQDIGCCEPPGCQPAGRPPALRFSCSRCPLRRLQPVNTDAPLKIGTVPVGPSSWRAPGTLWVRAAAGFSPQYPSARRTEVRRSTLKTCATVFLKSAIVCPSGGAMEHSEMLRRVAQAVIDMDPEGAAARFSGCRSACHG